MDDDERELTEITVEELLRRYAGGERDFTNVAIDDWREDLPKGIDLSGINLEGSYLRVDFSGAILKKANFRSNVWDLVAWEDVDFSGSDMTGIENVNTYFFIRCNFSNTIWNQAILWQASFMGCDLTGVNFDDAKLIEVRFKDKS